MTIILEFCHALYDGNVNLSIASLPLMLLFAASVHWYSIAQVEKHKIQGGWANQNPRAFVARLNAKAAMGKKLNDIEEFILRGQSAQQNGFEWWAVWAAAVILGYLAKLPKSDMDWYTGFHVLTRIIFYYLYLTTSSRRSSLLRTLVFQFTLFPAVAAIIKASIVLI